MKINKLKTLPIILMLLVTLLILVPQVNESNALPGEFTDIRDGYKGHLIRVYNHETMSFTTSEASHVLHGWVGLTKQELKDLEPFEVKVYLDGIEIELDNCKEKVGLGQDKTYNVWFYQTFETNYFTPGIYNWTVVWSDVTGEVWYQSHPLTVLTDPHRIGVFAHDSMIISSNERSYVKHGWTGLTDEDITNLEPLNVQVLLDGEEIKLYSIKEEKGENIYDVLFYQYFDAGYFAPGVYNWTVVWSDVTGEVWCGSYPLIVLNDPHRIKVWNDPGSMTITTSERSYIRHGWSWSPEDIEDVSFYEELPYNVQLYIDDQEIDLYQKLEIIYDEFDNPTSYLWLFYYYFDNGYFAPGVYNWTVVWSVGSETYLTLQHPLTVLEDPHRLNLYASTGGVNEESLIITTSERSYIRHGWSWSPEDIEDVSFYEGSFDFELYIDDQEIDLFQKLETDYDEYGNPTRYRLLFYQNFDANYFAPGIYDITGVWSSLLESLTHSHPLVVLRESHRLSLFNPQSLTITALERSYIQHGIGFSPEHINEPGFYDEMPYDVQLFIGVDEIDLYQKLEIDYDEYGNPVYYRYLFYQNFDAYYFEPGHYFLTMRWTDVNGVVQYEITETLTVLEDGHRLNMFRPDTLGIFNSKSSFIRHGWGFSSDNFGNEEFYDSIPYEVYMDIDGYEIELDQKLEIVYDEFGDPSNYYLWFYHVFEEYHFLPGMYEVTFGWYEGDGDFYEKTETLYVYSDGLPSNLDVSIDYSHGMAVAEHEAVFLEKNLIACGSNFFIIDGSFSIQPETDVLLISASTTDFSTGELDDIYNWFYDIGPRLLWVAGDSDYDGQFDPIYNNEILSTIGSRLRLSSDAVMDDVRNDGMPYRVAVNYPFSDGALNSIFTTGVSSIIMHGPSNVLGYIDGAVIDLVYNDYLDGIEIIMASSMYSYAVNQDGSPNILDYYSSYGILGIYPMIVIEDFGDNKYVIVSGEAIFSDYKNMYGLTTAAGIWNNGFHDGKILVDNILSWFGTLVP